MVKQKAIKRNRITYKNLVDEWVDDDYYEHFEKLENGWSNEVSPWVDVTKEGERLYNIMLDDKIEEGSPIDCLISAMNATSWHIAIRIMARILKLDYDSLEDIMEGEEPDNYDDLVMEVNKWKKERKRI